MPQGYKMDPNQLRAICRDLLSGLSYNKVKTLRKVAKSTLQNIKSKLAEKGISTNAELNAISDAELAVVMYGSDARVIPAGRRGTRIKTGHRSFSRIDDTKLMPVDFPAVAREFADNSRLTKEDLYKRHVLQAAETGLEPYKRTAFLKRLNACISNSKGPDVYMHREHAWGDELQIDWCGDTFPIICDNKGTVRNYNIIVMAWSASYYFTAAFVPDMTTKTTCEALREALLFFNCLPLRFVIDNAKALVTKHSKGHEAILNEKFSYFASRCGIAVDANPPYTPNAKSCVEHCVNRIEHTVLGFMKGLEGLLTLEEANAKLRELIQRFVLNHSFRDGGPNDTRAVLFESREKPSARPITTALPHYIDHYSFLCVGLDYHVQINGANYSVPSVYAGRLVEADDDGGMISIFTRQDHKLIATHIRQQPGGTSTLIEHMPEAHKVVRQREIKYKCAEDIISAAEKIGPNTVNYCRFLLAKGSFTEHKMGCIRVLNKILHNKSEEKIYEEALGQVMHSCHPDKINSYTVDDYVKELRAYASTHGGTFPKQTSITLPNAGGNPDDAFLRGADSFDELDKKGQNNK